MKVKCCSYFSPYLWHVACRKADEARVCSDKTWRFLQTRIVTFKDKYNFWVFYRWINVTSICRFQVKALQRCFVILISTSYATNSANSCVLSFFIVSQGTGSFTDPDYHLIWMVSPSTYSALTRVYWRTNLLPVDVNQHLVIMHVQRCVTQK
jgi:hypothetical protein